MKYKYVILDFDGTLADTAEGIYHTFTKVLTILGKQVPDDLSAHIGPPLEYSYRLLAGDDAEKAIALHRQVFAEDEAYKMSRLYDGVEDMLQKLAAAGCVLSVASSKYQPHADKSIRYFHIEKYLYKVYGQNEKRGFKQEVLRQLIADSGWQKDSCIMVGDTCYDVEGALANGIDAMAVTYGFGQLRQLSRCGAKYIANSPRQVAEILLGEK